MIILISFQPPQLGYFDSRNKQNGRIDKNNSPQDSGEIPELVLINSNSFVKKENKESLENRTYQYQSQIACGKVNDFSMLKILGNKQENGKINRQYPDGQQDKFQIIGLPIITSFGPNKTKSDIVDQPE